MDVSIVIPAHNEEGRLKATLELYSQWLWGRYRESFEIVVVANGCKDRTAQVAYDFMSTCGQIKVIEIQERVGKGGAVLEGFRQATGEAIAFVDADGSTSPASLLNLLEQLENAEVVIGSRWLKNSTVAHRQPILRRICSRIFNLSIHLLFHLPYRDTQCGAKSFRRSAAKVLSTVVKEHYWTFDVDLLLWANLFQMKVLEMPVAWEDKPGSRLKYGSTCQEVFSALWRMKRREGRSLGDIDRMSALREVSL